MEPSPKGLTLPFPGGLQFVLKESGKHGNVDSTLKGERMALQLEVEAVGNWKW